MILDLLDMMQCKIAYHLPAMGGLTAGVSYVDSGAGTGSADNTVGFKYAMDAGWCFYNNWWCNCWYNFKEL